MNTIRVFNTLTGQYEDTEVTEEIRNEYLRSYWREDMQDRRYVKRCVFDVVERLVAQESTEEHVLWQEEKECLFTELKKVDERQRKILIAYYMRGRSLQRIADEMGISVSYVSRLKRKGLMTLAEGYSEFYR